MRFDALHLSAASNGGCLWASPIDTRFRSWLKSDSRVDGAACRCASCMTHWRLRLSLQGNIIRGGGFDSLFCFFFSPLYYFFFYKQSPILVVVSVRLERRRLTNKKRRNDFEHRRRKKGGPFPEIVDVVYVWTI